MITLSSRPFRNAGLALWGAGSLASIGAAASTWEANAQTLADNARLLGAIEASRGVSPGDCAAFRHYILDEAKAFADQMSGTFLTSASRFTKAGCKTSDAQGEIQIITETVQDGASLRTARRRMGTIDILGISGVKGCHRPPNGVCPAQTGANALRRPASGG
jgi:hypothetical protein